MAASNQYSLGDYIILNSPKPLPELKRLRVECRRAGAFEATRHRVMPHGVPPGRHVPGAGTGQRPKASRTTAMPLTPSPEPSEDGGVLMGADCLQHRARPLPRPVF